MKKKDLAKIALTTFTLLGTMPAGAIAADATQETILAKGGCGGNRSGGGACSAASSSQTPKFSSCTASGKCSAATAPTTPSTTSPGMQGQAGQAGYNPQGYNQTQGYGRPMERAADNANRPYGARPNQDADFDETQQQQMPSSSYRTNPANPQNR
jgi:hypothetical protein